MTLKKNRREPSSFKAIIYDSETGKVINLESLIFRLGVIAVAKKYGVTESAVRKWRRKIHRPSKKTIIRSLRKLI